MYRRVTRLDRRLRRRVVGIILAMGVCTAIAFVGALSMEPRRTLSMEIRETASIVVSRKTVGFADSDLYFMSSTDVNKTLDMMQSAGVNTVRVMVPWAGIEKTKGTYNWTAVDRIVNAANARGMSVLGMINSTPQWAAQAGQPALSGPPASNAVFADFTKRVATRYAGKISAYEVWNEENATVFWSTGADPAAYTQMLKAVYPAIKAADPNATVLVGGLSPLPHAQGMMSPVDYLKGMYAAGAKGYFDALAYHPYATTTFSQSYYQSGGALNVLVKLRQLMVSKGDSKLIWATEYGMPTGPGLLTEAQQAEYIRNFLSKWRTYTYLGPAYIYTTRDSTLNAATFGVWRSNWIPKPAVAVILSFTGGPIQTLQSLAMAMMAGSETSPPALPRLLSAAIDGGMKSAQTVVGAGAALTSWALGAVAATAQAVTAGLAGVAQQAAAPSSVDTSSSATTLSATLDEHRTAAADSLSAQSESATPGSNHNESTEEPEVSEAQVETVEEKTEATTKTDETAKDEAVKDVKEETAKTETVKTETTKTETTKSDETKTDKPDSDSDSGEGAAA
jgi:polysaccharide biosynthesis protein PslG